MNNSRPLVSVAVVGHGSLGCSEATECVSESVDVRRIFVASPEPIVPIGGEQFSVLLATLVSALFFWRIFRSYTLLVLEMLSSWASTTVIVFLRTGIGTRAIETKELLCATAFLYIAGNMVGHNYHDFYRDRSATILGARVHFSYLVLFVVMAGYRKFEAWRLRNIIDPDGFGPPSRLIHWWHRLTGPRGASIEFVSEPLFVILCGLALALVFHIWFGWYLVLTGCLFCYRTVILKYV
jgi:hypothetical protein